MSDRAWLFLENQRLNTRIPELEGEIIRHGRDYGELRATYDKLEAERDELKARLDICHRDIDALMQSADKSEAERDKLKTRNKQLEDVLIDASTALHTALGMVEENGFVPDWDYLRQVRKSVRTALSAEGG